MKKLLPSPAMVVACGALAVSLGGVGYAASVLPANSVGAKQIRNGAINAAKVKPGSLLARSFAPNQLPQGNPGPQGPKGDTGAAGAPGPQGPKGDSGALTAIVRQVTDANVQPGQGASLDIPCNTGERATGGGGSFFGGYYAADHLRSSMPVHMIRDVKGNPTGGTASVPTGAAADAWEVNAVNGGNVARDFVGWVVCVTA